MRQTEVLDAGVTAVSVTPNALVWEVERFRAIVTNPQVRLVDKARAWDAVVRHASTLDSHESGFERAGVALKEALCLWLDVRSAPAHQ